MNLNGLPKKTRVAGFVEFDAAGTYLWQCPANIYFAVVDACGGGTGGQFVAGGTGGGRGGSGAPYLGARALTLTPGMLYTVVVGSGSAAAFSPSNGGDTSITDNAGNQVFLSKGAVFSPASAGGGGAGGAGGANGTNLGTPGQSTATGTGGGVGSSAASSGGGGGGGASRGNGGTGADGTSVGAGEMPGTQGGGGGGCYGNGANTPSGAGGDGYLSITYFMDYLV